MTKTEWWRMIAHTPHGIGISVCILMGFKYGAPALILGGTWWGTCLFYQWIEDWRIQDNSYLDIRGLKVGMVLGAAFFPPLSKVIEWWILLWR